ncbi:MAG: hypothetical protein ACLTS6_07740 [Anaerobutyricum sp.]
MIEQTYSGSGRLCRENAADKTKDKGRSISSSRNTTEQDKLQKNREKRSDNHDISGTARNGEKNCVRRCDFVCDYLEAERLKQKINLYESKKPIRCRCALQSG